MAHARSHRTANPHHDYASTRRRPTNSSKEPGAGYRPLADLIASARHSVRMVMYELHHQDVVAALAADHQRGSAVKVLLDKAFHGPDTNADAYARLQRARVDVTWAPAEVIVHQKTIIVDDSTARREHRQPRLALLPHQP